MALLTKKSKDLPDGAVRLSKAEALTHQRKMVENWPSEVEVFFLKYGNIIMGASALLTSTLITNHYRRVVKADWKVFTFTFFPLSVVPTYYSMENTERRLTNNVLLMTDNCPLCYHLKFAAHQYFISVLFPTLYGMATNIGYAHLRKTYVFPDFTRPKAEHWKVLWGIFKSGTKTIQSTALLQAVLILLLPTMQAKELLNVMESLKHDDYDSELLES